MLEKGGIEYYTVLHIYMYTNRRAKTKQINVVIISVGGMIEGQT